MESFEGLELIPLAGPAYLELRLGGRRRKLTDTGKNDDVTAVAVFSEAAEIVGGCERLILAPKRDETGERLGFLESLSDPAAKAQLYVMLFRLWGGL